MIKFTYDAILARMKANLQTRLENTGMLFYSTNQKILEAIAEEMEEEMRYDEYLTRESKWALAQNTTSIMNQTDFFNYSPHRKIGAKGEVKVSASETFNGSYFRNITIPKFSQFAAEDGTVFSSSEAINLLSTQNSTMIPVVQGAHKTSTFEITVAYSESELELLELFEENDSIENDLYEVRVNGILWNQVDSLNLSESSTSKNYTLKTNKDFSGVTLQFGDGIQSRKLEYGDQVTFDYLETLGGSGEVLQTNIVTSIVDTLYDISKNVVQLYCTNLEQIIGGDSIEDIETIRENAPRALRLSSRVITSEDYVSYILGQGILDKVIVWGETEQNEDMGRSLGTFIPLSENTINISGLSYSDSLIVTAASDTQKLDVRNALVNVKGLTDMVSFVDPKITFLQFEVLAYYNSDTYTSTLVESAISDSLFDEFSIDNTSFKQSLYFSNYYELINKLPEVDHHETELTLVQYDSKVEESSLGTGSYYFSLETLHKNIFEKSLSIYVKNIDGTLSSDHPHADWFLVATDDGTGKFIGEEIPESLRSDPEVPEFYSVEVESSSASLKYDYGKVCDIMGNISRLHIDSGMVLKSSGYQIKLTFKTGTNSRVDVIPTSRQQIFVIESVNILTDSI